MLLGLLYVLAMRAMDKDNSATYHITDKLVFTSVIGHGLDSLGVDDGDGDGDDPRPGLRTLARKAGASESEIQAADQAAHQHHAFYTLVLEHADNPERKAARLAQLVLAILPLASWRCGPSSPSRVLVCAACTLNATGQSRVTLSLW